MTDRARVPYAIVVVLCSVAIALTLTPPPAGAQITATCDGKLATIIGTPAKDRIIGTSGDDVIVGLGGADVIYGGKGNDTICGGEGPDKIYGGRHSDTIFGEQGNDRINGEAGSDFVSGGSGRDVVLGGAGADAVTGQGGGDRRLKGGAGVDTTNGGSGRDRCEVESADSLLKKCETDIDGRPIDDDRPADPDVAALYDLVEDEILPTYGEDNQWIGSAWEYIKSQGSIDAGSHIDGGFVRTECTWTQNELATCRAVNMSIGENGTNQVEVVLHELAHVYEQTTSLAANRSAMGIALMYLEVTYPDTPCAAPELLADAMVRTAMSDSVAPYWRYHCGNTVPNNPRPRDLAVVRSGLADIDHPWLADNYADGAQAWGALIDLEPASELATAFDDKYDGYCSARHTNDVLYRGVEDPNPFRDDGC